MYMYVYKNNKDIDGLTFVLVYLKDHYDFGMRAVKTVISAAGNLKRENPDMNEVRNVSFVIRKHDTKTKTCWINISFFCILSVSQELICLRAIQDVNVPKFLQDDLKLFNGIVSDLFPKTKQEPINYGILDESMRNVCAKKNLKDVDG